MSAKKNRSTPVEIRYNVEGMHCHSCELLVESKLRQRPGVRSATASAARGEVVVKVAGRRPTAGQLTHLFAEDGYVFTEARSRRDGLGHSPAQAQHAGPAVARVAGDRGGMALPLAAGALLIAAFLWLERLGLAGMLEVRSGSSLWAVVLLGLLAGFSTCAALVGGIVLSLSRGWAGAGRGATGMWQLRAPLEFNAGRLLSYAGFGAVLGAIGGRFDISPTATAVLAGLVSVAMALTALSMLGIRLPIHLPLSLPKRLGGYALEAANGGRSLPFLAGALTFILPCGFTFTAQGLAVLSGDPARGALTMLAFALGTMPSLLLIGFTGVRLASDRRLSLSFSRVAGVLVLFFALYTANAQLNVLGLWSFADLTGALAAPAATIARAGTPLPRATIYSSVPQPAAPEGDASLVPVDANGVQVMRMEALAYAYRPNQFRVRAGVPVRWEISDVGASGCTNAVISRGLFAGEVRLTRGQTSVKEFTPTEPGRYKFSCWMGMVAGVIEVVSTS